MPTARTTRVSRFRTGWRARTTRASRSTDTVAVTIDDDDVPGIQVAADPATAMVEEGQTIDLDVKLNTQPTGNVTVTLTVPSELSASASTLTFTTGNWSTVQTVTVDRDR